MRNLIQLLVATAAMVAIVLVTAAVMWCVGAVVAVIATSGVPGSGFEALGPVKLSGESLLLGQSAWVVCSVITGALVALWTRMVKGIGRWLPVIAGAVAAGLLHWVALLNLVVFGWLDEQELFDLLGPAVLYAIAGAVGAWLAAVLRRRAVAHRERQSSGLMHTDPELPGDSGAR